MPTLDLSLAAPPGLRQTLQILAARALDHTDVWQARVRQRRALAALDAHLLRDIGVDPVQAANEARKPFWQE